MKKFLNTNFFYGHDVSFPEELALYKRPKHKFYIFFIKKPINYHIEIRFFHIELFLGLYDDLNSAIIDHWIHFLHYGRKTGHVKFENNFYFDKKFYNDNYHPKLDNYFCELEHYLTEGWKKGFNPSAFFDTSFYVNKNVRDYNSHISPLEHFLKIGIFKGYTPFFVNFYYENINTSSEIIRSLQFSKVKREENYQVPYLNASEILSDSLTVFCPLGLGDAVAIEPIFRFLKNKYEDKKLYAIFFMGQAEICKYNKNIDGIIVLNRNGDVRALIKEISDKTTIVNCVLNGTVMPFRKSSFLWINPNNRINIYNYYDDNCILSALSECGGLPKLNVTPYFWKKNSINNVIPTKEKYIVIHCKSAEKNRTWSAKKFNELVNILLKDGYKIVEIGAQRIVENSSKSYFDLTKKISFQEIYSLIENSYMFIGVDSVFLHFANCAEVRAVCIAGPVKVRFNGGKRFFFRQIPCSGDFYYQKKNRYCYPNTSSNIDSISVKDVYDTVKDLENHVS